MCFTFVITNPLVCDVCFIEIVRVHFHFKIKGLDDVSCLLLYLDIYLASAFGSCLARSLRCVWFMGLNIELGRLCESFSPMAGLVQGSRITFGGLANTN